MKIINEPAKGLFLIENLSFSDERGLFQKLFCPTQLKEIWGNRQVLQANRSITQNKGAFRGFHFQYPPYCEMKFVQCIKGSVYDYAIDLRMDSDTFLQHFRFELSSKNSLGLIIPEGFAHGFQTIEPQSELVYFHSAHYVPQSESGLNYQDPLLKIDLPFPISDISIKDKNFPFLDSHYKGIKL